MCIENPIKIKKSTSSTDIDICQNIRFQVFVKGQNVPVDEEIDGLDSKCEHYLLFEQQNPIGTARVRFVDNYAKIERVAILETHQGKGLGQKLMTYIIKDIQKNSMTPKAKLGAQTHAIKFYEKLGFEVCSDEYIDAGIQHKNMQFKFNR